MFGQLMSARLKAAENALRDGRLDEAYRLATAPDLRDHRRAAAVRAGLTERFIERARNHFHADRFADALSDLDRAEAGGTRQDEIAELRKNVLAVAAEQKRKEDARRERLVDAVRRIEGGSLAAGRRILDDASLTDHAAQQLRQDLAKRAEDCAAILEQAERLLAEGQLEAAAERVRKAKLIDAFHEGVARMEAKLCDRVLEEALQAFRAGKLSRCEHELTALGDLGSTWPQRRELASALTIAREAAQAMQSLQYADARRSLLSLQRLFEGVAWINQCIDELRRLEELRTSLEAGPLGEAAKGFNLGLNRGRHGQAVLAHAAPRPPAIEQTLPVPPRVRIEEPAERRLLLLVDGGGSYLLLRSPRVSIGRVASENPADVVIFSDLAERHVEIARVEEDYFLFAAREVEVAGRPTTQHLLRDGDRVVLGRNGKLTFRLPTRQSLTAVLDLSDTTKMPNDVRRVLLFHQHALIGNSPGAHVFCRHAGAALVLFERAGSLYVRPKADGHTDATVVGVTIGQATDVGGVRFVVEPWRLPGPSDKLSRGL
jgi:hypothetical protein